MKNIFLFLIIIFLSRTSWAQIYKCTDQDGKVTFSQIECSRYGINTQQSIRRSPAGSVRVENSELEKLQSEERKLSNMLTIAEIDRRQMGNQNSREQAQNKIERISNDLIFVREQILQIKDPKGYRDYLTEKNRILREDIVSQEVTRANAEADIARSEASNSLKEAERAKIQARNAQFEAESAQFEAERARQEAEQARQAAEQAEHDAWQAKLDARNGHF